MTHGIRYSISAYIISDSGKFETVATFESTFPVPEVLGDPDAKEILAILGIDELHPIIAAADDWRLMTDVEIAQYKARINA